MVRTLDLSNIRQLRFFIIGMGITGASVSRFLQNKCRQVIIWDDNNRDLKTTIETKCPGGNISPFNNAMKPLTEFDVVVISPGLSKFASHPLLEMALAANALIISAFDIFKYYTKNSIHIGITGTVAKSTVTAMTYHMMKIIGADVVMCGNIGLPYFDITSFDTKYNVCELSSYELENSYNPCTETVLITNLHPWHLERHKNIKQYAKAKLRSIGSSSNVILNSDDKNTKKIITPMLIEQFGGSFLEKNVSFFSIKRICANSVSIINSKCYINGSRLDIDIPTNLCNERGLLNLASAIAIIHRHCKIDTAKINKAISTFKGLEHRHEYVRNINNIAFINDSKATNLIAVQSGINSLPGNVILITGGEMSKKDLSKESKLDYRDIIMKRLSNKILKLFIIGDVAKYHLSKEYPTIDLPFELSLELTAAVHNAYTFAKNWAKRNPSQECYILLAPGYQSFDQFKNFEHRGVVFKELVNAI